MMQHLPAMIGYLVMEVLACIALYIRMSRRAKPLGSIIMFLLDASLGIFVIGDLVYLYLMGRDLKKLEQMQAAVPNPQDRNIAKVVGNVAIKETSNGVVVVHRRNGSNYTETFPNR